MTTNQFTSDQGFAQVTSTLASVADGVFVESISIRPAVFATIKSRKQFERMLECASEGHRKSLQRAVVSGECSVLALTGQDVAFLKTVGIAV